MSTTGRTASAATGVSPARRYVLFGVFAVVSIVLDQWTKVLARDVLRPLGPYRPKVVIDGFFKLRYSENPGVAFGMLQSMSGGRIVLTLMAIAAFALVIFYLRKTDAGATRLQVALGLVGGGAIGNLIDRVHLRPRDRLHRLARQGPRVAGVQHRRRGAVHRRGADGARHAEAPAGGDRIVLTPEASRRAMKPMLLSLHLGGREIGLHTYGVLIGCGCAVAIVLAFREARRQGLDGSKILDLSFWMLVTGLLGSRLLYVALNARTFARICAGGGDDEIAARSLGRVLGDCTRVFQVWEGGLVFYGGFIAAGLVAFFFARRQGWSFWALGDLFAPSLAIGHAFGRLGCFTAGCCFGKACDVAAHWCTRFAADSVAFEQLRSVSAVPDGATLTPPLFPTQLYEAIGELAIFGVLLLVRRRLRGAAPRRRSASARAGHADPALRRALRPAALRRRDVPRRLRAPLPGPSRDAAPGALAGPAGRRGGAAVDGTGGQRRRGAGGDRGADPSPARRPLRSPRPSAGEG